MSLADMYPDGVDASTRSRIIAYIEARIECPESGCWVWKGRKTPNGYGTAAHGGHNFRAHRLAYEAIKGYIPPTSELVLDHLCRNRACCNPAHLEPVTNRENLMRGEGVAAKGARQTHCAQGHSFEIHGARRANGYRWCRECSRIRDAKRAHIRPRKRSLPRTHCKRGHAVEVFGARRANGFRWCRECQRIRDRKRLKEPRSQVSL